MMFYSPDIYSQAIKFIARIYQNQDSPELGFAAFTHAVSVCGEVTAGLIHHPEYDGDLAIQCAFLHGILRHTGMRYEHLKRLFGINVSNSVFALTRDEGLPNSPPNLQLIDSIRRIKTRPKEIWMVEMANWIVKLDTPQNRATKFRLNRICHEAAAIHIALKDACPYLANRLMGRLEAHAAR